MRWVRVRVRIVCSMEVDDLCSPTSSYDILCLDATHLVHSILVLEICAVAVYPQAQLSYAAIIYREMQKYLFIVL